LVKVDHIIFKNNAYHTILESDESVTISDHKNCRMGKWYDSQGREIFGKTKAYREMDEPHSIVHNQVFKAFELLKIKQLSKVITLVKFMIIFLLWKMHLKFFLKN